MANNAFNWFNKPTKKQATIIFLIWLISNAMLIIGITDVFKKPIPFYIILVLIVPSTIAMITTVSNYRKQQSHKQ